MMKTVEKRILRLFAGLLMLSLPAAGSVERPAQAENPAAKQGELPPPPEWMKKPTEEEARAMRAMYRSNPEGFKALMRERAEKARAAEKAYWDEVEKLGKAYREATDEKVKAGLKNEIVRRCTDEYRRRLKFSRERLDELKRKVKKLEAEQLRREETAGKAIQFRVEHVLSGTPMPPPPKPPRGDEFRK